MLRSPWLPTLIPDSKHSDQGHTPMKNTAISKDMLALAPPRLSTVIQTHLPHGGEAKKMLQASRQ